MQAGLGKGSKYRNRNQAIVSFSTYLYVSVVVITLPFSQVCLLFFKFFLTLFFSLGWGATAQLLNKSHRDLCFLMNVWPLLGLFLASF